ncbi:hypothetical protein RclHR1_02600003 [Rhizophagus clarus]|uniref:Uncharacterized protein n=1 Tax=Rhizophagus clarus TaxID=94130 RepID=A0A2Z6RCQ3_9GLOM|nr:hypothetical protein RclHR1_02600003 [Rhizophagus clarus]GES82595.1 hypothetical protein GLOIN_2v1627270 [Rhizophagus clarus]
MSNFYDPRFESNNNDPFKRDDIPFNMINFGKKSQLIMENFKNCCEEIKFDNNEIMTYVVILIKEQRKIFRKFAEDSIKLSDNLLDYSIDLLFFIDCFKDNRYSDDELLELLNDLLIKSKENHRMVKDLKKVIINKDEIENTDTIPKDNIKNKPRSVGIKDKLIDVQNFLPEYVEIIKKYPGSISPDYISKIKKEITQKCNRKKRSLFSSTVALVSCVGAGILIACAPAAVTVATVGTVISFVSNIYSYFNLFKARRNDKTINCLVKKLKVEADELVKKIELFSGSLETIVLEIITFEIFWENQIEKIDFLIKNLGGFKKTEKRHNKDKIINSIEKKWKDVERECQIYSHEMKDLLIRDEYIKVKF